MAWCDRAVAPATNSRKTYLAAGRVTVDCTKTFVARLAFAFFRMVFSVNWSGANPSRQTRDRHPKGRQGLFAWASAACAPAWEPPGFGRLWPTGDASPNRSP